jgi:hypothetical protein
MMKQHSSTLAVEVTRTSLTISNVPPQMAQEDVAAYQTRLLDATNTIKVHQTEMASGHDVS